MKNGFTLIELLAVIVILGVLSVIIIPSVMKAIEDSRTAAYNQLISNIEQTTQLYIRDNKENITGINIVDNNITITLQDLVDVVNLKTPVIDPRSDEEIALSTQINILVKQHNKYTVTVGEFQYVGE